MKCLLVSILLIASTSSSALAADQELKLITGEIAPYTDEENGKQSGAVLEVVAAMAKELGRSPKFEFLPWKRAVEQAKDTPSDGNIYGIIPLARSPERESHYKWIALILKDEVPLVTLTKQKEASQMETALELTVGALRGSPGEQLLKDKGFKHIESATDDNSCAKKLAAGHIDAWLAGKMSSAKNFAKNGFDPKKLKYGMVMRVQELFLGASINTPDAEIKKWEDALAKVKAKGIYQKIVDKYLPPSKAAK